MVKMRVRGAQCRCDGGLWVDDFSSAQEENLGPNLHCPTFSNKEARKMSEVLPGSYVSKGIIK